MTVFAYKAKKTPVDVLKGTVAAGSREEAIDRLRAMGCSLLSLEEAREGESGGGGLTLPGLRRVSVADLAIFWRQLASLLEVGMPLVLALSTVAEQSESRELRGIVGQVRRSVEEAASLSAALSRFPSVFRPEHVSIVAAGEATGRLAEVCEQLAGHVEKEHDLRGKLRSALMYPAFLCLVGAIVIGVLVTFVIPKFGVLFASYGRELPLATRVLLGVSGFARRYWHVSLGSAALAVLIGYRSTRSGRGRLALDTLRLRLPILGRVIRRIEMARFAHTLGTLCANGVQILPAFEIAARTVGNKAIAREVVAARDRIARGSRVAGALRAGRYFPPALVNMVSVGEDSASLDKMLGKVATVYERESDRVVDSLTRLLESALIVLLAGVVGMIVAAVLLPIFQASEFVG